MAKRLKRLFKITPDDANIQQVQHQEKKQVELPEIDVNNPDSQNSSLLFKLPAEVRNQIYEEVFGAGFVHIRLRRCRSTDNWIPSSWHEFPDDPQMPNQYEKWSYQTCLEPHAWAGPYFASKTPAAFQALSSVSHSPFDYEHIHCDCDMATRELGYGEYAMVDCKDAGNIRREHFFPQDRCKSCKHLNRELIKLYGPAAEGLKRWHSDTGIELGLLQTCRLIYHESHLLPFSSYTFDLNGSSMRLNASKIRDYLPSDGGLRRIETVLVQHCCANELYRLIKALPALKSLKVAQDCKASIYGAASDWERYFSVSRIRDVQVITGSGNGDQDARAACRAYSTALEGFLSSSSWEEAEEVANAYSAMPLKHEKQLEGFRMLRQSSVCHSLTKDEIHD